MKTFGLEQKNLVSVITSAHGDSITDVTFWRGLVVSCSQDQTCSIINYTQGNDGIIYTISNDKPLSLITVYNDKYLAVASSDNAYLLLDGETTDTVFSIEDLRTVTKITDYDGYSVLRGCTINNAIHVTLSGPTGELLFYQWNGNTQFIHTFAHKYHTDMVRDYKLMNDMIFSVGDDGYVCKYQLLPQQQYLQLLVQYNVSMQQTTQLQPFQPYNQQRGNNANGFREGFQRRTHRNMSEY